MAKKSKNLRSGIPLLGGSLIDDLNAMGEAAGKPGMGTRLATELNRRFITINTRQDAQAGLRGSVAIAPQKRRASRGAPAPGLLLRQNRIGEVDDAINDDEVPNWGQVRGLFTCEHFGGHVSGFPGWVEECVEGEKAAAGEGIMPYFFGWTVHIPPEADTLVIDPFAGETVIRLWSFVLPEPAIVDRVSYYMQIFTFTSIPPTINIGLYDVNLNLIFETGGIDVSDPANPAVVEDGAFTFELDQSYDLASGEYFLAFASGVCMRMIGIATSPFSLALLNHAEVQDEGLTTPGPYGLRFFEFDVGTSTTKPYDELPSVIDATTGTFVNMYELHEDVPMILFEGVKAQYG